MLNHKPDENSGNRNGNDTGSQIKIPWFHYDGVCKYDTIVQSIVRIIYF